jgi:hypothetical protein
VPQPLHRVLASLTLVIWRIGKRDTGGTHEYRRSRHNAGSAFHCIDE